MFFWTATLKFSKFGVKYFLILCYFENACAKEMFTPFEH